ncbi:uncharacterized protein [Chiloscyllium punctatum]|uniref:uncharacterized protein n=1 Tax=Chiloscyllium punctatum TaxID=137246 RepID=UPI003B634FFF
MSGYKFKQSKAVTNCIRDLHLLKSKLESQLKTFTAKGQESDQSTQSSELQKKLEKIKNELSWLHASYDVPFCQNWSEHAYKVQKKTKETISRKLIELFETVIVPRNMSMNDLCLSLAIAFKQTNCFYLAMEKETFPESRKIVLQDKKTKKFVEDFSGYQLNVSVRRILKLPLTGVVEVNPNAYPDYHRYDFSRLFSLKLPCVDNDILGTPAESYYAYWSSAIPMIVHGDTDILEDIVHNHLTNMSFMSSPRSRCINGSTLLHTAAYFGKTDIIETLLQLKVDVNLLDYKGATPLHRSRDMETMQLLIYHGADVNRSDADGNTPLHVICFGEMKKPARLDCLEILLSCKAAIDRWNNKELLPIHCAAMQGRIDVIQLLCKFDSEEQMVTKLMKGSAPSLLYLSLANNHIECAKWLSEKDFSFKAEEQEELMFGLLHDEIKVPEKVESLELLIKNGVNINAFDKHGDSALHLAAVKVSCNELLTLLLSNNAKVNVLNRDHCTPLFFAVQTSNYYGASLLIKHGADIKQKNNQGVSAFDLIQDYHEWIESGCFTEEIVVLLKAYEIKQACSLVRNINRKLKLKEASQQSSIMRLRQATLSQPCFWVQT